MSKETTEILIKLEEARVNLVRLAATQHELEQTIEILKQSISQVRNPESGLLTLFLRSISSNTEFYKSKYQLYTTENNIADAIGLLGKTLVAERTSKPIMQSDGKPQEIITPQNEKKGFNDKIRKGYKKRKRAIQGHRITGRLAQKVEEDYGTTLTKERYLQTLEAIALHPDAPYETILKEVNLLSNSLYAHIRYGQQAQDIQMADNKYQLKQNGVSILSSLKTDFKGTTINNNNNTKKYDRGDVHGTPLTDSDALSIHMKYDTPVLEERYKQVLDILEHAIGYKKTHEEIVSQTGWSKNNTMAHLRYGIRKKEIETFTFKEYVFYCLKRFKDQAIPKEPVSASRMY